MRFRCKTLASRLKLANICLTLVNRTFFGPLTPKTIKENLLKKIRIDLLKEFENHPFKVIDDEELMKLTWSIKFHGVLSR